MHATPERNVLFRFQDIGQQLDLREYEQRIRNPLVQSCERRVAPTRSDRYRVPVSSITTCSRARNCQHFANRDPAMRAIHGIWSKSSLPVLTVQTSNSYWANFCFVNGSSSRMRSSV